MFYGSKDPKAAALMLCPIGMVLCVGLGIYALFSEPGVTGAICFFVGAALLSLPLIAAHNRKVSLRGNGFVYRTWLGGEYEYKYSEVEWYDDAGHDPVLHVRDRKLYIDFGAPEWPELQKRLTALGIPSSDPAKSLSTDESGERAIKTLRLYGRVPAAVGMLALAAISAALPVLMLLFPPIAEGLVNNICFWLLIVFFAFSSLLFINYALVFLITRIELYAEGFSYVDPIGRKHEYSYSDAVSCKIQKGGKYNSYPNPGFHLKMTDKRTLRVDLHMLNSGLGERIGFDFAKGRLDKEQ